MSEKNKIDMKIWVTQQSFALEKNVTVQCVHNWIKRGKIKSKKIEGSRLQLVDRSSYTYKDGRKRRK